MRQYQPAGAHVISDVIENEAIIVNLNSGAYFSLAGAGGAIWALLAEGVGEDTLLHTATAQYTGDPDAIRDSVRALLAELESEDLLIVVEVDEPDPVEVACDAPPIPFEPPVLEKFTDMADLLLLDPIHEVDDVGWPHTRVVGGG